MSEKKENIEEKTPEVKTESKKEKKKVEPKPQEMNPMKNAILKYLEERAKTEPLFAKTLAKENKNIHDCETYIINAVKKTGRQGFTDGEIFSMAVHYYDEDDIDIGKPITGVKVVVNEEVKLTPEEIEAAKEKAIREVIEKEKERLTAKKTPPKKEEKKEESKFEQGSLF